ALLSPSLQSSAATPRLLSLIGKREMLENPPPTLPAADTAIRRHAPPNLRNRPLNRRKSADRFDQIKNLYENDVEKNQVGASRNFPIIDHGDSGSSNLLNENHCSGLIALEGCCRSEASRLLDDRWAAALDCYNNPSIDLSERPVMYAGTAPSAWSFRLPHQMMAPVGAGPYGSPMDFLGELRRAQRNANTNFGT
ncbi:hypothetical protein F2P56_010816, partial [Juglans regia]